MQERLGRQLQAAAHIRIVDCPVKLSPLNISMWWNALYEKDLAHTWLRSTLLEVATQGSANADEAAAQ